MKSCIVQACGAKAIRGVYCNKHGLQMKTHGCIRDSCRKPKDPNKFIMENDHCKIEMYNRDSEVVGYALIDLDDVEKCKPYKWCLCNGYPYNNNVGMLHGFILCVHTNRLTVGEHKNRNPLDNRKPNLRLASNTGNNANKTTPKNNTSGYKGVTWYKKYRKWMAQISHNRIHYNLGYYQDKKEAAMAYNQKAIELFGEFALLNEVQAKLVPEGGGVLYFS